MDQATSGVRGNLCLSVDTVRPASARQSLRHVRIGPCSEVFFRQVNGYMALPVTGDWAVCQNPEVVAQHKATRVISRSLWAHGGHRAKSLAVTPGESVRPGCSGCSTHVYAPPGLPHHRWEGSLQGVGDRGLWESLCIGAAG